MTENSKATAVGVTTAVGTATVTALIAAAVPPVVGAAAAVAIPAIAAGTLGFVGSQHRHPYRDAQRALRGPVVGRKNYYGSGAQWSGELSATLFSLFHTLERWRINPRTWLTE